MPQKPVSASTLPECPIATCLKFLSGAWTHNIMWFLKDGPLRFSELRRHLTGISSKVLSDRLKDMEQQGVVFRHVLPGTPPGVAYELTDLGHAFAPIFASMVDVAAKLRERQELRHRNLEAASHPLSPSPAISSHTLAEPALSLS